MANKRVIVIGQGSVQLSSIMDEADVATYVTDAKTIGYFESDDSDVYIPWETASVKVQAENAPYTP